MPEHANADDRLAGAALAGASVLSILAMAHHPSGVGHDGLAQIVHGAMIAIVVVLFSGYVRLARRLGLHRFTVLLALTLCGAGAIANILAATINGFVVGQLVAHGVGPDTLRLCWELNQALAYGAVYAASAAFLIWGAHLLARAGLARVIGAIAMAAGLAAAALLMAGTLAMNVAGAFIVYSLHAVFGVAAGGYLTHATRTNA